MRSLRNDAHAAPPPAPTRLLLRASPSAPALGDQSPSVRWSVSQGPSSAAGPPAPRSSTALASAAGLGQKTPRASADSRLFLSHREGPRAPSLGGVSASLPCRLTLKKSPDTRARTPDARRAPGAPACSAIRAQPLTKPRAPSTPGAFSATSRGWPGATDQSPVLSTSLGPLTRVTERRHYLKRKSQPTPIFTTLNPSAQLSCDRNAAP